MPAASNADRFAAARLSLAGPAFAVIGIPGFSFKAILMVLGGVTLVTMKPAPA